MLARRAGRPGAARFARIGVLDVCLHLVVVKRHGRRREGHVGRQINGIVGDPRQVDRPRKGRRRRTEPPGKRGVCVLLDAPREEVVFRDREIGNGVADVVVIARVGVDRAVCRFAVRGLVEITVVRTRNVESVAARLDRNDRVPVAFDIAPVKPGVGDDLVENRKVPGRTREGHGVRPADVVMRPRIVEFEIERARARRGLVREQTEGRTGRRHVEVGAHDREILDVPTSRRRPDESAEVGGGGVRLRDRCGVDLHGVEGDVGGEPLGTENAAHDPVRRRSGRAHLDRDVGEVDRAAALDVGRVRGSGDRRTEAGFAVRVDGFRIGQTDRRAVEQDLLIRPVENVSDHAADVSFIVAAVFIRGGEIVYDRTVFPARYRNGERIARTRPDGAADVGRIGRIDLIIKRDRRDVEIGQGQTARRVGGETPDVDRVDVLNEPDVSVERKIGKSRPLRLRKEPVMGVTADLPVGAARRKRAARGGEPPYLAGRERKRMPVPVERAPEGAVRAVVARQTRQTRAGEVDIVAERQVRGEQRRALVRGFKLQSSHRLRAELDVQRRFRKVGHRAHLGHAALHHDGVRRHIDGEKVVFGQSRAVKTKDLAPGIYVVDRIGNRRVAFQRPSGVFSAAAGVDQRSAARADDRARRPVAGRVVLIICREVGRSPDAKHALRKRPDEPGIETSRHFYGTVHVDKTAAHPRVADQPAARRVAGGGTGGGHVDLRDRHVRGRCIDLTDQPARGGRVRGQGDPRIGDRQSVGQTPREISARDAAARRSRGEVDVQSLAARRVAGEGETVAVIEKIAEHAAGVPRRRDPHSARDGVGTVQVKSHAVRVVAVVTEKTARPGGAGHSARNGVVGDPAPEFDPGRRRRVIDVTDDPSGVTGGGRDRVDACVVRRVQRQGRAFAHKADDASGVTAGGGDRKGGARPRRRHRKTCVLAERAADGPCVFGSADREVGVVRKSDRYGAAVGDLPDQTFKVGRLGSFGQRKQSDRPVR